MIIILIVLLAILFGGHFFIYFSLIKFFEITGNNAKLCLGVILAILSVSFIASSILAHYNENGLTRTLYFSSGIWLGVALNLVMAFAVVWALVWIYGSAGSAIYQKYLVALAIVIAFAYSGCGIWNAYHPKLKHIEIKIKNLPSAWRNKTAVQISDVHLGLVLGADFLRGVVDQINSAKPDVVFITGDLFDGMDGKLDSLVKPLDDIKAPDGMYFVTGNHETYLGVDEALGALQKTRVKILDDKMTSIDGMQIIGIGYPQRMEKKNIVNVVDNLPGFDRNQPSILLYHNPDAVKQAEAAGVSLMLAGHTHKGQLFPISFIDRLIYGRYYYGLNQDGNFSIYTSAGVGTWGPTMRTDATPEIVVIKFESLN